MLPEVSGTELIVLAAVALIVVGPKDLPALLRKVGQFVGKLRGFANDFRHSFDEMARQSELDELRKEVEALRHNRITDPLGVQSTFDEIDQNLRSADEVKAETEFWAQQGQVGSESHPTILPPDAQPVPEDAPAPEAAPAEAAPQPTAQPEPQPEPGARLR